ncbi:MAG: DUF4082 domain-containing protein, partial [Planctomycetota bacterium]
MFSARVTKLPVYFLAILFSMGLAASADATNYPFGQQSPSGAGFNTFTTGNFDLGYEFTVTGSAVTVTQLGTTHPVANTTVTITLWTSTGTNLARVTTTSGPNWSFVNLSTPVQLTQGSNYIVSQVSVGYWHNFNNPSGWGGDSNIAYVQGRYLSATTPTFPTTIQASHMGVPDIGYTTGPPAPASITVPATNNTGTYTVSWTASAGATSYELEEDTNVGFTSATQIYSGANLSHTVTGQSPGTYYYRVRARDANGPSG